MVQTIVLRSIQFFAIAILVAFASTAASAEDACVTDLNGDGATTDADAAVLSAALGSEVGDEGYVATADLDGDGQVTTTDYGLFVSCQS